MTRPSRRTWSDVVRVAATLLIFPILVEPAGASAASPEPSASVQPSQVPEPGIEVWLDEPLPIAPAAGANVDVAFVLWDGRLLTTVHDAAPFIRLRSEVEPPSAAVGVARETSPGHFAASLVAPSGPPPIVLEVGFPGMACAPRGGACEDIEFVFAIGGVGPPPDARLNALARASIDGLASVSAGHPLDVRVLLELVGPWNPEDVDVPGQLFLLVRENRDKDRAIALGSRPESPLAFVGTAAFDAPGDYDVAVSTEPQRSAATIFTDSAIRVRVVEGGLVELGGGPPYSLIAVGALILVVVIVVGRRVLADL